MYRSAARFAERATGDVLISPDWGINMELCDIINIYPGQAKDVLKIIKKRLGSKRPVTQLITLTVLDALIKNCVQPDINVKEKILVLIDTWQEAIGVKFPQFIQTLNSLKDAGIEFPHHEENAVSLFTPPQGPQPQVKPSGNSSNSKDAAVASALSLSEVQTAQKLAYFLTEMLDIYQNNSKGVNKELLVDLAEQCQSYQKRVQNIANNTTDDSILFKGLAVNDDLQRLLRRREKIVQGFACTPNVKPESHASQFIGESHCEDEAEGDFSHLAPRPFGTPKLNSSSLRLNPTSAATSPFRFDKQPVNDNLASLKRPTASWGSQATSSLSTPPARYNPGQRFLDEHGDSLSSSSACGSSPNNSFPSDRSSVSRYESEDALFNDLVDFVKSMASPSSISSNLN